MTDPQHLPSWRHEQNEAEQDTEAEYWESFGKYVPLDPATSAAPWNESEEDGG